MRQRVDTENGLLIVEYDGALVDAVGKALGNLKDQRFKVLKNAVNATARQAKKQLAAKMSAEFTAKKGPINRSMKIQPKATDSSPKATITVTGPAQEIGEFKTTTSKSGIKARVRKGEPLKLIQSQKGSRAKAFLATFESGHTAIVQRQDGQEYTRGYQKRKDKYAPNKVDMTRIKKLLSISFPGMGSSVIGELEPDIYDTLLENVSKEIKRVMRT